MKKIYIKTLSLILFVFLANQVFAQKKIAYIYGSVDADGNIPAQDAPFEQMLLNDTCGFGISKFRNMVRNEGYNISAHYDADTTLTNTFLNNYDVIIFGLHQKIWSSREKNRLDNWIRNGGGVLTYSDSASGGFGRKVGFFNDVGQKATNNIINRYGMGVTLDYANGTFGYKAPNSIKNPIVKGGVVFQGEGLSIVAVDESLGAQALMPITRTNNIDEFSGDKNIGKLEGSNKLGNLGVNNPVFTAIGLAPVGSGNVIAIFDRQPLLNNSTTANFGTADNKEILRRIVNYLASSSGSNSGTDLDLVISATSFDKESNPGDDSNIKKFASKVGFIKNGNYIQFNNFNFGDGASSIDINIAKGNNTNATVKVFAGRIGRRPLATIKVSNTGGWDSFKTFGSGFTRASRASGVKNLIFVFEGGNGSLMDIKSFTVNSK